jgi:macrophage erythroblast attacher
MKDEQVHLFSSLKERVNHLKQLDNTPSLDSDEFAKWSRVRLDRLIVDYLLRKGYSTTAQAMVEQERHLEPLVDQDLFKQCRNIEEALAQKDCGPCLSWCAENKTGLKKLQSNLEFNLRIQELVELIRARKSAEAINYSKRHLIPNFMNKFHEIQQAISLLAFPPDTTCPPYKQLYDLDRWQGLVKDFRDNLYNLHCLTLIPMLELSLYSGLCSLKCTQCFLDRSKNTDCPICDRETFGTLAKPLPYIQHNTSTLVCRISGKVMDDNNPPMALPNGYVYSQKAILDHIQHSSNGKFKCPRSNGEFDLSQIRKVFIS